MSCQPLISYVKQLTGPDLLAGGTSFVSTVFSNTVKKGFKRRDNSMHVLLYMQMKMSWCGGLFKGRPLRRQPASRLRPHGSNRIARLVRIETLIYGIRCYGGPVCPEFRLCSCVVEAQKLTPPLEHWLRAPSTRRAMILSKRRLNLSSRGVGYSTLSPIVSTALAARA
ncbi:hypothetical protein BDW02DRAFT_570987 [Decorospora gaudefroyi]|uniref:Uncharacterized protein n=1 Tax=Decorospora gaudefroyi TaxID=184978 RepID=A0A6A5K3I3_9PLEO|nr:hypothetical protein BDW02DRAFT_571814 [Decorospora gaudefroyi]KAF1832509.1 hypothetical protein BDW02DRAFT_570987 [Decorospora gaudefroyi]